MADFRANRRGIADLARTAEMRRFVGDVADEAVGNMERLADGFTRKRATFRVEVGQSSDGVEGRAIVDSSFWHWREFGTSKMAARPYIRPGAQQALNRRGGRLGRSK